MQRLPPSAPNFGRQGREGWAALGSALVVQDSVLKSRALPAKATSTNLAETDRGGCIAGMQS